MVEIRKAVMGDLKRIQELSLLLFEKEHREYDELLNLDWTFGKKGEDCFRRHLTKENSCVFVAEDGGKIVGYLVGEEVKIENYRNTTKMAELDNMFVLEKYRDKGVDGMLYDIFVKWCEQRKVKLLRVVASAENERAIRFYRKNEFKDFSLVLERKI